MKVKGVLLLCAAVALLAWVSSALAQMQGNDVSAQDTFSIVLSYVFF